MPSGEPSAMMVNCLSKRGWASTGASTQRLLSSSIASSWSLENFVVNFPFCSKGRKGSAILA